MEACVSKLPSKDVLSESEVKLLKRGLRADKKLTDYKEACHLISLWEKLMKLEDFDTTRLQLFASENLKCDNLTNEARESLVGIFPPKLIGFNRNTRRYDTIDTFLNPDYSFKYSTESNGVSQFNDLDLKEKIDTSRLHNHSYKATGAGLPTFLTMKGEKTKFKSVKWGKNGVEIVDDGTENSKVRLPYYGIELEVLCRKTAPDDSIGAVTKCMDKFVICKSDSSIGGIGFEIVTVPATYDYHKQEWKKFFDSEKGVSKHFKSWVSGTCGLHIHISRNAFTKGHLARFVCFINDVHNYSFISDVAGRDTSAYARLIKEYTYQQVLRDPFHNLQGRRGATNLMNDHTIEVRIFRGNTREKGFFKCLEFVDAVYYYTQQCGYKYSKEEGRPLFKYEDFLTWLQAHSFNYTNLMDWLREKEYIGGTKRLINKEKEVYNWRKQCA